MSSCYFHTFGFARSLSIEEIFEYPVFVVSGLSYDLEYILQQTVGLLLCLEVAAGNTTRREITWCKKTPTPDSKHNTSNNNQLGMSDFPSTFEDFEVEFADNLADCYRNTLTF